jgi:hypothetical protein
VPTLACCAPLAPPTPTHGSATPRPPSGCSLKLIDAPRTTAPPPPLASAPPLAEHVPAVVRPRVDCGAQLGLVELVALPAPARSPGIGPAVDRSVRRRRQAGEDLRMLDNCSGTSLRPPAIPRAVESLLRGVGAACRLAWLLVAMLSQFDERSAAFSLPLCAKRQRADSRVRGSTLYLALNGSSGRTTHVRRGPSGRDLRARGAGPQAG